MGLEAKRESVGKEKESVPKNMMENGAGEVLVPAARARGWLENKRTKGHEHFNAGAVRDVPQRTRAMVMMRGEAGGAREEKARA